MIHAQRESFNWGQTEESRTNLSQILRGKAGDLKAYEISSNCVNIQHHNVGNYGKCTIFSVNMILL